MTPSRGALLLAGLLGGCATLPPNERLADLADLIAFDNVALCEPAPVFSDFLQAQIAGDANEGFRPGTVKVPARYGRAVGRIRVTREPGYWLVRVPVRGRWLGMPITAVYQALPEGGDPGDFGIELTAPVAIAEQRLRAAGFPARAGVDVQLGEPDGYAHVMTLVSAPGRSDLSILGCGYQ